MRNAPSVMRNGPPYLPPYSPDFTPIEQLFAKLKALLRKAAERSVDGLWNRIAGLLEEESGAPSAWSSAIATNAASSSAAERGCRAGSHAERRPTARTRAAADPTRAPSSRRAADAPKVPGQSILSSQKKGQRQGGHLRPIEDFDESPLRLPGSQSHDQSDHFIEHPRRCGSAAKDRLKRTIVAGFVVIPQQRETFLHRAR